MQLKDLVKPISQMSDEELLEHLRQVRHRRTVEKPATKVRVERAERKVSRGKVSGVEKLIANLSPEDRAALIKQLESQDGKGEGAV